MVMKPFTGQEASLLAALAQCPDMPLSQKKEAVDHLKGKAREIASILAGIDVNPRASVKQSADEIVRWANGLPNLPTSQKEASGALFKCPKCGAEPQKHGKGTCFETQDGFPCAGMLCECDPRNNPCSDDDDHGVAFTNMCHEARCYHCGWNGTMPVKPKGMQAWEKKALEAGWSPPADRAKELGL